MDSLLGGLPDQVLRFIEDLLSNDHDSDDEDLLALFQIIGLSDAQARRALSYRPQYRGKPHLNGSSPIRGQGTQHPPVQLH